MPRREETQTQGQRSCPRSEPRGGELWAKLHSQDDTQAQTRNPGQSLTELLARLEPGTEATTRSRSCDNRDDSRAFDLGSVLPATATLGRNGGDAPAGATGKAAVDSAPRLRARRWGQAGGASALRPPASRRAQTTVLGRGALPPSQLHRCFWIQASVSLSFSPPSTLNANVTSPEKGGTRTQTERESGVLQDGEAKRKNETGAFHSPGL